MRAFLAAPLAALMILVVASAASSAPVAPVTATFCGGSLNLSRLVEGLTGTAVDSGALQSLQGSTVTLRRLPGRADVTVGTQSTSIPWNESTDGICQSRPPGTVFLPEAASVSGETIAVIAAVLSYRQAHPWPTSFGAHADAADSSIFVAKRGTYSYVGLSDNLAHHGEVARESCRYSEFYRVNPTTLEVLPYNGCIVGGASLKGILPAANELPDR